VPATGDDLLGVVLAGGSGTRMGGGKPFRRLAGRTLLQRALDNLAPFCPRRMVVADDLTPLTHLPCELLADRWPGQGPLAAMLTAMLDSDAQRFLVLAVDLPLVRPPVLELLLRRSGDAWAVAAAGPRGVEPLLALYHRRCLPVAQRLVDAGERRPRMLLEMVQANLLPPHEMAQADPDGFSLLNVNHPQDLEYAGQLAKACGLFDTPN